MRFGLTLTQLYPAGYDLRDQFREVVELTATAAEGGLACVSLGHHHLSHPTQNLHPFPLLGRLTAESGDMALLTAILVLPLYHPVDVAEQAATLQIISGDRFILGVGLGYREDEFATFGFGMNERLGRFLESIAVMRRLWTEDLVEHEGQYYRVVNGRMPLKSPSGHLTPVWYGAENERGIRRAGRIADGFCVGGYLTLPTVEAQIALFREARAKAGLAGPGGISLRRELYLTERREDAWAQAAPAVKSRGGVYDGWGKGEAFVPQDAVAAGAGDPERNPYLIGNPDDVIRLIRNYQERVDVTFMNFTVRSPVGTHAQALSALRLFCKEVLPAVSQE
jgi:alkanesulfonate monooxygenase SsuD/methylene tetrahydromethanopterin reductase-like flavin-dependent oxidoreductase (luciferase family)